MESVVSVDKTHASLGMRFYPHVNMYFPNRFGHVIPNKWAEVCKHAVEHEYNRV